MQRRFRDIIIYSDGSIETTNSTHWHEANGDYTHRNALYNELGYRAYTALLKENGEYKDLFISKW